MCLFVVAITIATDRIAVLVMVSKAESIVLYCIYHLGKKKKKKFFFFFFALVTRTSISKKILVRGPIY